MVAQGMDYSAVCTSLITDMSDVFLNIVKIGIYQAGM